MQRAVRASAAHVGGDADDHASTGQEANTSAVDETVVKLVLQAHRAPNGSRRNIRDTHHVLQQVPTRGRRITRNLVRDVLREHCEHCAQRVGHKGMAKIADWTPITALGVHERNQIDLIDFSAHSCRVPCDALFGQDVIMAYVLVVIDIFSKFVWLYAIPDKRPERIIQCLETLYSTIGYPAILQCDNGREFVALASLAFWADKGVSVVRTSVRSPNQNGQVERSVRTIRSLMGDMVAPDVIWPLAISSVATAYNTRPHPGAAGLPPFEVFYGRRFDRTSHDIAREIEALARTATDADVEATAEGSQHGSWLRDLRLNDHGLQQHYARRPTFRGTTYSAAHALVTYLQSAPLLTMSNNDELRIARVTNVTTITRGADEYVDKVTVTTGDGGTETFDFASFVDGVTLQANLNEMTSTLSEKMDADVIVECLNIALQRDQVLQHKTKQQFTQQRPPLHVAAGSNVAVASAAIQPAFASKRRRTVGVLQQEISSDTDQRARVRVKRIGSGASSSVPLSKLYVLKR